MILLSARFFCKKRSHIRQREIMQVKNGQKPINASF